MQISKRAIRQIQWHNFGKALKHKAFDTKKALHLTHNGGLQGLFRWAPTLRLREAQHHWARAHIMDAKRPIICGLPQPRSFVPRKGGMMFSLRSK